ncbi:MAG: substrate-binding domain-containing protein [Planctomycetota bacterium]|nr:substrate-binding domain-containing protein [Planctomycetota bacterium]
MKKIIPLIVLLALAAAVIITTVTRKKSSEEPIAWYGPMLHPYVTEVQAGASACEKDLGTAIYKMVGQEWTQDNENVNVEALSTKGHKAFSIYPGDAAGANGLFSQLKRKGQLVVAFGCEPALPTAAAFTVATDIKGAAMFAAEELIKLMGDSESCDNASGPRWHCRLNLPALRLQHPVSPHTPRVMLPDGLVLAEGEVAGAGIASGVPTPLWSWR